MRRMRLFRRSGNPKSSTPALPSKRQVHGISADLKDFRDLLGREVLLEL
jgi:hypothetical protein